MKQAIIKSTVYCPACDYALPVGPGSSGVSHCPICHQDVEWRSIEDRLDNLEVLAWRIYDELAASPRVRLRGKLPRVRRQARTP